MANLTEVQMAFKQGEKTKAAQLLKTLLHERPSADAWVMAARMTNNPETAKQHLQRALAFEPKHVKARDMLRDLGGTPMSNSAAFTNGLLPALQTELEKFGAKRPIIKNFSPKQRMITAISMFSGVLILIFVMLSVLFTTAPVPVMPEITPITVYQSDTLISNWDAVGLNIRDLVHVAQAPNVHSNEEITFTVMDDSGSHNVIVFLYKDVASIVNDGQRLSALTADKKHKLDILQTAVIIYPAAMNETTVNILMSEFNSKPSSPV